MKKENELRQISKEQGVLICNCVCWCLKPGWRMEKVL